MDTSSLKKQIQLKHKYYDWSGLELYHGDIFQIYNKPIYGVFEFCNYYYKPTYLNYFDKTDFISHVQIENTVRASMCIKSPYNEKYYLEYIPDLSLKRLNYRFYISKIPNKELNIVGVKQASELLLIQKKIFQDNPNQDKKYYLKD